MWKKSVLWKSGCAVVRSTEGVCKRVSGKKTRSAQTVEILSSVFLDALEAGMLARTLEEGTQCPVCGATHHPKPTPNARNGARKKEVDREKGTAYRGGKKTAHLESATAGNLNDRLKQQKQTVWGTGCERIWGESAELQKHWQRIKTMKIYPNYGNGLQRRNIS